MNKQRKQKMYLRAIAYATAQRVLCDTSKGDRGNHGADSLSWEAGYLAAMRDARKALEASVEKRHAEDKYEGFALVPDDMRAFLRPLR